MSARALFDELTGAGLKVRTLDGWETRGGSWIAGVPVGVMQHHTAPPVPFPPERLIGNLLKANMSTDPDGTVWLLAYGACNYSSGPGTRRVREELAEGILPTANAADRGLSDDSNGNPWFWNFENGHRGDGSPIPSLQLQVIARATAVVLRHFDLDARLPAVIAHAEWTRRKTDPYWNGSRRAIEELRQLVRRQTEMLYRGVRNVPDRDWAREVVDDGIETGVIRIDDDSPDDWEEPITYGEVWVLLDRLRWPKGDHR